VELAWGRGLGGVRFNSFIEHTDDTRLNTWSRQDRLFGRHGRSRHGHKHKTPPREELLLQGAPVRCRPTAVAPSTHTDM